MASVNYYQLLGLEATASDTEIRRAYLKLSLQWHPDKRRILLQDTTSPDNLQANDIYQLIQEAYATLSCPEKRCLYDFVGAFAALADAADTALPGAGATRTSPGPRGCSPPWASSSGDPPATWFPPSPRSASASASASRASPCPSSDTCASSSGHSDSRGAAGQPQQCMRDAGPHPAGGVAATSGAGDRVEPHVPAAAAVAPQSSTTVAPQVPEPALQPPPPPQSQQPCLHFDGMPPLGGHLQRAPPLVDIASPGTAPDDPAATAAGPAHSPVLSPGAMLGKRRAPGADQASAAPAPPSAPLGPPQPQPHHQLHQQQQQQHSLPPQPLTLTSLRNLAGYALIAGGAAGQPVPPCSPAHQQTTAAGSRCFAGGSVSAGPSADVTHPLWLTLEEMYSGCVKQLRLARRVYRASAPGCIGAGARCPAPAAPPDGRAAEAGCCVVQMEELFRVVVQPGWRAGMRVTFPGKGDELPGRGAGDMVLVVAQAAHATFERRGHDLHTVLPVPLLTALAGGSAALTTLDGRTLTLALGPACLQPHSQAVLKGEGMPIMQGRGRGRAAGPAGAAGPGQDVGPGRGDLHVRFEVTFPEDLTLQQKAELREVLLG